MASRQQRRSARSGACLGLAGCSWRGARGRVLRGELRRVHSPLPQGAGWSRGIRPRVGMPVIIDRGDGRGIADFCPWQTAPWSLLSPAGSSFRPIRLSRDAPAFRGSFLHLSQMRYGGVSPRCQNSGSAAAPVCIPRRDRMRQISWGGGARLLDEPHREPCPPGASRS